MTGSKYLVLLAGAMLATGAVAGGDEHSMQSSDRKFDQLDTNQDRSLSKSEASKDETLSATFASIDADGDGEVSRNEYAAHMAESEGQSNRDWASSSEGYSSEGE